MVSVFTLNIEHFEALLSQQYLGLPHFLYNLQNLTPIKSVDVYKRQVFNMKYFDDMKYEDIAEVLDVAVGTLKATYHNAVKKIEESLKISDTLPSFE